jgi:hypothetical protein
MSILQKNTVWIEYDPRQEPRVNLDKDILCNLRVISVNTEKFNKHYKANELKKFVVTFEETH